MVLSHTNGKSDGLVVKIGLQGTEDATLDFLNLVHSQLVLYHQLNMGELSDFGRHVLHTSGHTTKTLGHAIAHRHPLQFQILLAEHFFVVKTRHVRIVVSKCSWNDVHLALWIVLVVQILPRETYLRLQLRARGRSVSGSGGATRFISITSLTSFTRWSRQSRITRSGYNRLSRSHLRSCLLGLSLLYQLLKQGFQSSGLTPTASPLVRLCNLSDFYQCQLNEQTLVAGLTIIDVALVHQLQSLI